VALKDEGICRVQEQAVGVDCECQKVLVSLGQSLAVNIVEADNRFLRRRRMDKWDYEVLLLAPNLARGKLVELGEDGWELVAVLPMTTPTLVRCFLKKRRPRTGGRRTGTDISAPIPHSQN
jgi:hypothetical protein